MAKWKKWSVWAMAGLLSVTAGFSAAGQETETETELMMPETETETELVLPETGRGTLPGELSPREELAELINQQEFPGGAAWRALGEELGISGMAENIKTGGIDTSLKLFLTEDTMSQMGIDDPAEGSYGELSFRYSPVSNNWELEGGLTLLGMKLMDASLYGDRDMLAATVPLLWDGSAAIRSGSLLDQYQGSALSQYLGQFPLPRDIDLTFVPGEAGTLSDIGALWAGWKEEFQEAAENAVEDIQVEKFQEGEREIYEICFLSEDLEDCYLEFWDAYLDGLEQTQLVPRAEITQIREGLLRASTLRTFDTMGEKILEGRIEAEGGAIQEITLKVNVQEGDGNDGYRYDDSSGYDYDYDYGHEYSNEEETEYGHGTDDGYDQVASIPVSLNINAQLENNYMEVSLAVCENEEETEMSRIRVRSSSGETSAMDTMELYFRENQGSNFFPIYRQECYFDRETGRFQVEHIVTDEYGDTIGFAIDSSFSQVIPGESFVCTVNRAGIGTGYESLEMGLELRLNTGETVVEPPENPLMILEMSQEDASRWLDELNGNWTQMNELFGGSISSPEDWEEGLEYGTGYEMEYGTEFS